MSSEIKMDMDKSSMVDGDYKNPVEYTTEIGTVIEIDPKLEAAAMRKFDIFVLPVSVIFLVLSSLDRNNVSEAFDI